MNVRIDHSNYEAWLLDRLEGNLTPAQEQELDAFLAAHPELDPGMDDLPTLDQLDVALSTADKDALKRALPPTGLPSLTHIDDFLVARLEGDLTTEQLTALHLFLQAHPELQRSAQLYDLVKLVPEAMAFAAKRDLERQLPPVGQPDRHTLDDFLVAELEGDLTTEQQRALAGYLALHPEAGRSRELIQRTRIPAAAVVYPQKGALKRGGRVIPLGTWAVRFAAAASVAVLLGAGIWFLGQPQPSPSSMAEVEQSGTSTTEVPKNTTTGSGNDASTPEASTSNDGTSGSSAGATQPGGERPATGRTDERRTPRELGPEALPQRSIGLDLLAAEQRTPRAVIPVDGTWLPTDGPYADADDPGATPVASTLGGVLASVLRERLLAQPGGNTDPLGRNDAVAAVDLGLKAVGGEEAGVTVKEQDRRRFFNIRLGRNLSVSASTKH